MRLRFVVGLLLLLALFPTKVVAQYPRLPGEQMIQFRLYPGLSETSPLYRLDSWVPVAIEVDNPSDSVVEGNLSLIPSADSIGNIEGHVTEIPIHFAPAQRKMIRVLVRLPEWTEDVNLYFGREKLAIAGIREMDPAERVVVAMGEGRLEYNKIERHAEIDNEIKRYVTVVHLGQSQILPDRVEGYETATAVVWDGLKMDPPTESQNQALQDFVRLGGTLILGLGDAGARIRDFGWEDWLGELPDESRPLLVHTPVRTVGAAGPGKVLDGAVDWESNPSVPSATDETNELATLAANGPMPGVPCLFLDGEPILYRLKLGAGSILLSRIPWADFMKMGEEATGFWTSFVETLPNRPPSLSQDWESLQPFTDYLRTSLLGELPGPLFIGGFLGLYTLLLIPVNYLFFRKRKRLELAWLVLPPLALLFSFLAYHIGSLQQQGGVIQRQISLAFAPYGSSIARCQSMTALYSPKRTLFKIAPDKTRPLPLPELTQDNYGQERKEALDLRYVPSGAAGLYSAEQQAMLVNHWASNDLAYDTTVDLGGSLEVQAVESESGHYRLHAQNNTRFDIANLFFMVETRFYQVGRLASGEKKDFEMEKLEREFWSVPNRNRGYNPYFQNREYFEMPLERFMSQYGRALVATFPLNFDIEGRKVFDQFSPVGSIRQGVYAMAEIETPIAPVDFETTTFKSESVSLLLTPALVKNEGGRLSVGPTDWTISISDSSDNLTQFPLNLQDNYYWNQMGLEENAVIPPPYEIALAGQFPATATYVYRPNLSRDEDYRPVKLTGEWTEAQARRNFPNNVKLKDQWQCLNVSNGEWSDIETHEGVEIDLAPEALGPQLEVSLRVFVSPEENRSGDQLKNFNLNNYQPYPVNLPKLTLELEKSN
ncbi:MAG: hypothetical protein H6752_12595 [Candidatus Omnitrophica bacterium]|nr:hypothetical protein [Candidatus Omnitrophota bacterium]